ncbi:hypothetical protein VTK73DRAFT_4120 [Phialemonium thermophilum]|uniref:ABC transporter n=1 Tax=Phialemonium thermophilum TaxID=223376 RepID=A0ABR3WV58_9PEZI
MMGPVLDWSSFWPCFRCCDRFWIPSRAAIGPHCVGIVVHIPGLVALAVLLLRYACAPLWRRRPLWLRKFAAEEDLEAPPKALSSPWTWSLCSLLSLSLLGVVGGIAASLATGPGPIYSTPVLPCLVSCLILLVVRPRATPGPVLTIHVALLLVQILLGMSVPDLARGWAGLLWLAEMLVPSLTLIVILNMPMRDPLLDDADVSRPFTPPKASLRSPEDAFTLWQFLTVSWMQPLIALGRERQLHDEDVWFLPFEFQHQRLHLLFREIRGSVIGRLLRANGLDLCVMSVLGVVESVMTLSSVVFLRQLLAVLSDERGGTTRAALVYAVLTLLARWWVAQSNVISLWFSRRAYERSRGEMITMIYEKTLRRKAFTFPSRPAQESASSPDTSAAPTLWEEEEDDDDHNNNNETESRDGGTSSPTTKPGRLSSVTDKLRFLLGWKPRRGVASSRPAKGLPTTSSSSSSSADAASLPASTGKILNLMRNDVYEVAQRFWEFASLITKPLNFVLSVALVWRFLGGSSLWGIAILVAAQAVNAGVARAMLRVERARRAVTDVKLQLTSQFVEALRHLRWYGWEDAWLRQILDSRQAELAKRLTAGLLSKTIANVNNLASFTFPVAGFYGYTVLTGRPLTVDVAFPALDLFSQLQTSLQELPDLVTVLLNARVAMGRIEAFMAEPDKDEDDEEEQDHDDGRGRERAAAATTTTPPPPEEDLRIAVRGASFSWPGASRIVLRDVTFACRPGLTLVCGVVGAGKTALLHAILGELDQHGGQREVPSETIGYCAQTPWLESMSIRENILFCAAYDEQRYRQTLDACCLLPDLAEFKAGDLSMIGENGIGLSGGQRARVALARAVYSRSRILLLDDPIAALDHQTASDILRKLFGGSRSSSSSLTAGRLVVFVTHRVDLAMRYADQVLDVTDSGRVKTLSREELETDEELRHLASLAVDAHHDESEAGQKDGDDDDDDDDDDTAIPDRFIEEEYRAEGGVMLSVYWRYVKAGGLRWWALLVACFAAFRAVRVAYFWFLKKWGEAYGTQSSLSPFLGDHPSYYRKGYAQTYPQPQQQWASFEAATSSSFFDWFDVTRGLPDPGTNVSPWLLWFLALSLAQVLTYVLSDGVMLVIVYQAGKRLFAAVMRRVSNATFRFYDVTPVGRLMNRLTSDIGTMDGQIANQLMQVAWSGVSWASSVVVIAAVTPPFLALTLAMTAAFVWVFLRFLPASQSLRRLEMTSLSPLMSNFGTLLDGLTTVRAFRAQPHFEARIVATTDSFQKMDHFYWSLQSWLTYRFDSLSALSTFAMTVTALASGLSAGSVGFVLAAASNFVLATHQLCRKYGELQMQFLSVERVIELLDLEQEPRGRLQPPAAWPTYRDDIVFRDVTLRYAPGLEPSLRDVSFRIPAGSTVAVTGRSGSGKSTLALALLGTILPDGNRKDNDDDNDGGVPGSSGGSSNKGTIHIGSIDVAQVDKHALRRGITFVAQDPVLFPGTVRDNLDPLREHTDEECAEVLVRVLGGGGGGDGGGGRDETASTASTAAAAAGVARLRLDSPVDAGGRNLSQGQRQLIGLGRAVLRRSPVVILDEATASIDRKTAFYIQQVLREELKESTVITIAHRVEAVKDADYKIVLDKGRVVECGEIEREAE